MTTKKSQGQASRKVQRPTIKDVARQAGVSVWTVSKVLNGSTEVSIASDTRARVLECAASLGYRPNRMARALVQGRTNLIALWMISTGSYSSYFAWIQHALQSCVHADGYQCITEDVALAEAHEKECAHLLNWPAEGVLACDTAGPVEALLTYPQRLRPALVSLGLWCVRKADYVTFDLFRPVTEAVRHLIAQGCRRIAYLTPQPYDVRLRAYEATMKEAGLTPEVITTDGEPRASAREAIKAYAQDHTPPEGLLCQNDERALGAMRGIYDLGLRIPEDVAVVGCDGIIETEYMACPLSTIVVPVEEMCSLAWQFLKNRMADPSISQQTAVLQPQLVVRQSSLRKG